MNIACLICSLAFSGFVSNVDPAISRTDELKQLAQSLGEYCDEYEHAMLGSMTGRFGPPIFMMAMIRDRRIAKMHYILDGMDKQQAAKEILAIYEATIKEFKDGWGAINARSQTHRYQAMVLLLLVQQFCDEADFDEQAQDWAKWHIDHIETSDLFKHNAGPQPLFIINLYANQLVQQGESLEMVDKRIKSLCNDLKMEALPELVGEEFRNHPDHNDKKIKVAVLRWSAAQLYTDLETRKKAFAKVRQWLK